MTQRLYYGDSYTVHFTAKIIEQVGIENRPAVVLDHTYFYPTGGGQPHDTGAIDGIAVVDVLTRDGDKAVVHVLSEAVTGDEVSCRIDWGRRFDFMQHHTGQHILTQAFVQIANAQTVSFHLSGDSVTIDLDTTSLSPETLVKVEDLANQILYENRPVTARLVDPNQADGVRMRKMPDQLLTDGLRIIEVEGFDTTACGGTHIARTGEIGIIKIVKFERRGDKTRVEFRCGARALHDYREKNNALMKLTGELNTPYWEMEQAIANLREELKQSQRKLKDATTQLAEFEADHLLSNAVQYGDFKLVKAAFADREMGDLRALATKLTQQAGMIVLLGTSGEKANLLFARSQNLTQDMNALLKGALPHLGEARGGGKPDMAQGGGVKADSTQVSAALDAAEQGI